MLYEKTGTGKGVGEDLADGRWELSDVINAVRKRSAQIQPDKELLMLAVSRNDPEEQKKLVQFAVAMIDRGCAGGP